MGKHIYTHKEYLKNKDRQLKYNRNYYKRNSKKVSKYNSIWYQNRTREYKILKETRIIFSFIILFLIFIIWVQIFNGC